MLRHVARSLLQRSFQLTRTHKSARKIFPRTPAALAFRHGTRILPSRILGFFPERWYSTDIQEAPPEPQLKRVDPGKNLSALDRFLLKNQVSNIPEYVISKIDAVINWARKGTFYFHSSN
jgi:hypothetical protein